MDKWTPRYALIEYGLWAKELLYHLGNLSLSVGNND